MNEKTLKALKGSCEKWDDILHRDGVDKGSENCPLCHETGGCKQCPVYQKTGVVVCGETPWEDWCTHQLCHHDGDNPLSTWKIRCDGCRELAQKEYDFLRDLYIEALESTPAKMDRDYHGWDEEVEKSWVHECPSCDYIVILGTILEEDGGKVCCPQCKRWSLFNTWVEIAYDFSRGKFKHTQKKPRVEKEEWVDITENLQIRLASIRVKETQYYYPRFFDGETKVAYLTHDNDGKWELDLTVEADSRRYKIDYHESSFRILKRG